MPPQTPVDVQKNISCKHNVLILPFSEINVVCCVASVEIKMEI